MRYIPNPMKRYIFNLLLTVFVSLTPLAAPAVTMSFSSKASLQSALTPPLGTYRHPTTTRRCQITARAVHGIERIPVAQPLPSHRFQATSFRSFSASDFPSQSAPFSLQVQFEHSAIPLTSKHFPLIPDPSSPHPAFLSPDIPLQAAILCLTALSDKDPANSIDPLGLDWGKDWERIARQEVRDDQKTVVKKPFLAGLHGFSCTFRARVFSFIGVLDLPHTAVKLAESIAASFEEGRKVGIDNVENAWSSVQMAMNPAAPLAEAHDRTSYQASDLGREFDNWEVAERWANGTAATAGTTAYYSSSVIGLMRGITALRRMRGITALQRVSSIPETVIVAEKTGAKITVSIGEDLSSASGTRVWRHLPEGHPALADAKAGIIKPYGPATEAPLDVRVLAHDYGNTKGSGLTSWTADQAWALSRQQRMGGVVVETVAPEGSIWFNQAAKGVESQVLIPGTVRLK